MQNSISETDQRVELREKIRTGAIEEGFDAVGFARPTLSKQIVGDLELFLKRGHHGGMTWMETSAARRSEPSKLWDQAKSVITLGVNYAPQHDPLQVLARRRRGAISVYAQGADYHDVVKRRLKRFAGWIARTYSAQVKIFVDTAPLMEKPIAHQSGIGWQGKHTNLVSREFGSWLFLGSVFTSLDLPHDSPESDHCGSCKNCLDICPTKAFPEPYRIDARRCISYLTIEHKDHIAPEFRTAIGNRIYGCDDCLAVCPWNKFAQAAQELSFAPHPERNAPRLADLADLDDAKFRELFRGSPVKRIGRDRFVRNVLIAIGNSGDASLTACAESRLGDLSPLVRAMAIWALKRLLPPADFVRLGEQHASRESDADVAKEWHS